MQNSGRRSRVNKFEKRRKNTNFITILMFIGAMLIILLVGYWLLSSKDEDNSLPSSSTPAVENGDGNTSGENLGNETTDDKGVNDAPSDSNNSNKEKDNQNTTEEETPNDDLESDSNNQTNKDEDKNELEKEPTNDSNESSKNQDVETSEIVSSEDENVISAYTGNWQPIGTEQSEPHVSPFKEDTADWEEMKQAIALATDLEAEQMIVWFIGNGGDQKAIGTVSPSDNSETYRVYISWITNEGWQPTKVEILKENDYGKKEDKGNE